MTTTFARRLLTAAFLAGLSAGLAGCMSGGTTYGTGKSTGVQTLEDLAGIVAIGGPKKEPIEYGTRAPLVPPPAGTPLAAPGSQQATAANWPKDPDAQAKQFKADMAAREQSGGGGEFKIAVPARAASDGPDPRLSDPNGREREPHSTPEQQAAAKKLFADARGIPVDEYGNPVRRYLTDPPAAYRAPDPNAPIEVEAKPATKSKFKWPWQQ